ncbi:MAG: hypothetical protein HY287_08460 [Planctomycetes bacterium]|nr:hypothetical protein [Planctomycetota bacterium]
MSKQFGAGIKFGLMASLCTVGFVLSSAQVKVSADPRPEDTAKPSASDRTAGANGARIVDQSAGADQEIVGTPTIGGAGITETVEQIMTRERLASPPPPVTPRQRPRFRLGPLPEDPNALMSFAQPSVDWTPEAEAGLLNPPSPYLPQTLGTSFKAVGIADAPFIPPDSMGTVGPTQIVVHTNGRIRTFTKAGTADGALDTTDVTFWASVAPGVPVGTNPGITDPEVRYDRLSGRWILLAVTYAETVGNKTVIAVSSGSTIVNQASFTFYSFVLDSTRFCDYPSMGVDANAVYTGCNLFSSGGAFQRTSAAVIRKTSILSGGPIVTTTFANIGFYAPRGVDNDDPTATEGWIVGTDSGFTNRIDIRRISTPGGTPTSSATITLSVLNTNMVTQPASGSTTNLDVGSDQLFMAMIKRNKLTGVSSLWTAQSVEETAACVASTTASTDRRIGARWYEIAVPLSPTAPTITQQGNLCTTASSGTTDNAKRGFIYPTVTLSGQGHLALAATYASSTDFAGIAAAGRLRTDVSGGTRAPETILQSGLAAYTLNDGAARNRWGDYSFTAVDPNDDQTIWTFQEYADLTSTCTFGSCWSVRAVQLKAPPPPALATATAVCTGKASTTSTITGTESCAAPTCTNGLCTGGGTCPEFFDPQPPLLTGQTPAYANHITATVPSGAGTVIPWPTSNIIVPGTPATSRVLQMTLGLNTTSATAGTYTVTVTNPDGQAVTSGSAILTVNQTPTAPTASNNGPICATATLQLSASTVAGATYSWTGPNGFSSSAQNPSIPAATTAATGTYSVTVTAANGCTSSIATTTATVIANGGSCNDNNACTSNDVCSAGSCSGTTISCDDSNVCTTDGCDSLTGCTHTNNTNSCNDGLFCNGPDTCSGGSCSVHAGDPCAGGAECNNACNEAADNCFNSSATACTSDGNVCTDDFCNGSGTCVHTNNNIVCNDGNACTSSDVCSGGSCSGTTISCDDSNVCTDDSCNPATGCEHTNNTASCNDSNACTTNDTCFGGACQGGPPLNCNDNNGCTDDTCDPSTGCHHANNSNPCDDGSFCTTNDTCSGGSCAGTTVNCDDSNPCTDDSCNPASGCQYSNNTNSCDDGHACTNNDTCSGGVCSGTPIPGCIECTTASQCDDSNPCTTDTCPSGVCVYTNNSNSCDDGNACTTNDTCSGGSCVGGPPPNCDDSNICTDDACDTATGCYHTNNTNSCDDFNACTTNDTCSGGSCVGGPPLVCNDNNGCTDDTCNPATGCVYTDNSASCDDGNACTTNDTCAFGSCVGGPPLDCNDGNICTDDSCNPASGCVHVNNVAPCDDHDACTTGDTCAGGVCVGGPPPNCDDGNVCTDDACDHGTGCTHTNNTSACDDFNACTTGDTCADGSCMGGASLDCNDGNPCTDDSCNPATGCVYVNNFEPCDDGNACTSSDTCSGGDCSGTPITCDDSNPCTDDACNPASGCYHTDNSDPCDDHHDCTNPDTCSGGVCVGTPIPGCTECTGDADCSDGNPCTTDTCPAGVCVYTNNSNPCDDGNACTTSDTCSGGSCVGGSSPNCDDGNPCTDDSCNPFTGCVYMNNSSPCSDGDACTTNDTCSGGVCVGGSPLVCNDGNVCTDDTCDSGTGCVYTNNTASCDDGNACTTNDTCAGGSCVGGPPLVCNDGNSCTDDSCDMTQGCRYINNSDPCNDGNACTTNDTCAGGVCVGGDPPNCDDGNVCTTDGCDSLSGCTHVNNADSCSDGDACTTNDMCSGGVCVGGSPLACDDGNVCTDDSCNPGFGCVFTDNTDICSDGDACTTNDTCSGGTCGGTTINCDDGNPCTDDFCDSAFGCYHVNNSSPCNDGNACTTSDTCSAGMCVGGTALVCDDGNVCTTHTCDSITGCVYTNNSIPCDDGNACTSYDVCSNGACSGVPTDCNDGNACTDDFCNPATGCFYVNNTNPCDDGHPCTDNDTCSGGACNGTPIPNCPPECVIDSQCNDGNACTTDTCQNGLCVYTNNNNPCDDGDACTSNDACSGGSCVGGPPLDCNDHNVCTDDSCNPASGCVHVNNNSPCSDGNACTTNDMCSQGICVGGKPPHCDDGNACTDDSCNPATGCVHVNNTGPCSDGSVCTTNDACSGGVCVAGPPLNCNDGNVCTDDSCDVMLGCRHVNNTVSCDDGNSCTANDHCSGGVCAGTGSCAPPTPLPDPTSIDKNRYLSLQIASSATAAGSETALQVTLVSLMHPNPPNLPIYPPPNFSAFEGAIRWVGPVSNCQESETPLTTFKCARLQCSPNYVDWVASLSGQTLQVSGVEVVPSSAFDIRQFASSCQGSENTCAAVSSALRINTGRWGDILAPFQGPSPAPLTQPNITDVAAAVDKFKSVPTAIIVARADVNPAVPNERVDIADIANIVDGFKSLAYPFPGPSACP